MEKALEEKILAKLSKQSTPSTSQRPKKVKFDPPEEPSSEEEDQLQQYDDPSSSELSEEQYEEPHPAHLRYINIRSQIFGNSRKFY